MMLCRSDDEEMHQAFMAQLEIDCLPAGATFIAVRNEDEFMGGWMFERWTGPGGVVHVHWAANPQARGRWITRTTLNLVAAYVFGQLECKAAIGEAPANNSYVCGLNERVGFKRYTRIEGYFPDGDLVIYRMLKSDCRWLPPGLRGADGHGQA